MEEALLESWGRRRMLPDITLTWDLKGNPLNPPLQMDKYKKRLPNEEEG